MKKLLALLLAIFMLLSLVACNKNKQSEENKDVVEEQEEEVVVVEEDANEAEDQDTADVVEDEDLNSEDEELLGYEDPGNYTMLRYAAASATNWNPLTWETSEARSTVMIYVMSSLWDFDFDHDHPGYGYTIKTFMAEDLPTDITKDLAGDEKWGIPADAEEGYAYRITLKKDLVWENGEPITTEDYEYSIKMLLDPRAQNRRADSLYNGDCVVVGAKDYLYQGQDTQIPLSEMAKKEGFESVDAYLEEHGDEPAQVNWANSFGAIYDAEKGEWSEEGFENAVVEAGVTLNEMKQLFLDKVVGEWKESEETAIGFFNDETFVNFTYPEKDFSTVGFQVEDDYNMVVIFERPLTGFDFYYSGFNPDLVNEELYEKNLKVEEQDGKEIVSSSYGTSVETTLSYGPYKLVKFQDDKVVELERNENWQGYKDGSNKGLYQTDKVKITIVKEPATQLQMFLKGQLDGYGLSADQVEEYRGSDYILYTLGSYTDCLNVCRNLEALKAREEPGINKTILTLPDFRKALSLSMDRDDFAKAVTASSVAGFGLMNLRYIADTEEFIPYRDFEPAKENLVKVYGLEYGEGKEYATLDEAYDAMTGYDLELAKELFDKAYDEAIEKGLMKEGDVVSLDLYSGVDNEIVRKRYNYFKTNWQKAVKGTKLEGKFELNLDATAGDDYGKNFRNGLSDLLTAGWLGAEFNPYFLIGAYIMDAYRYDMAFDINQDLTIDVNGEEITQTILDWYNSLQGSGEHKYGKADIDRDTRIKILAAVEAAILNEYAAIPLIYSTSAELKSMKVEFYSDEYNGLVGYGSGTAYRTYNYTDEEWEAFVEEQGGELDYK